MGAVYGFLSDARNIARLMAESGAYQPTAGTRAPLLPKPRKDGPAAPNPPGNPPADDPYNPVTNPATDPAFNKILGLGGPWQKMLLDLLKQARKVGTAKPTLSEGFLSQYLTNFDPIKRAENETSLAYDDSINNLKSRLGSIDKGLPGITGDLDKWYGMLGTANQGAAAANAAKLNANVDEFGDSARAFMAAAGGAAQPGNPSIAQEAVIGEAGLRGMGQAQSNFDSNLGQFFQQAGAAQKSQILSQAMRDRSDLARQLASAEKERGLYKAKSSTEYGDDRLKLALQLRNDLYGQRKETSDSAFNRILGLANLAGMASSIGTDVNQGAVDTATKIEDWKRAITLNEQERLRLQQFQETMGGGEQYPFAQLQPGTRAQLAGQLMTNLLGPKGYLTVNPKQFLNTVSKRLYEVAGYQRTPQTEAFIQSLLEPRLVNWWNKYHPKQRYSG